MTPSRAPPPGGDQGEFSQRVSLFNTYALHARGVLEAVQNGTFSIAEQAAAIDLVRDSLHEAWGALESTAVPRQYVQDVAKLRLHWRSLQANPVFADPAAERDANAERIGLNQAIGSFDAITREAMYVIALDRLREWVLAQEPEYVVDLHRVLRDEIPNQAHREEVIEWLSSAPRVLAGVGAIIEPETGLIYRTYDRWPGRVGREAFVVLLILGTVAATILLAPFVSGDAAGTAADAAAVNAQAAGGDAQVPGAPRTQLMVIWIACLFGLLAHSVLTTYRSLRAGRLNGAFPLRRATTLLSARSGVITLRVLSTWVAFMALMVLVGHDAEVSFKLGLLTAFLIGYGSDSFIDTVTGMLETRAAATIEKLRDGSTATSAAER